MIPRWLSPDDAQGYRWYTVGAGRAFPFGAFDVWMKFGPVTVTLWHAKAVVLEVCAQGRCWKAWPWRSWERLL